jgi:hypothetical protein
VSTTTPSSRFGRFASRKPSDWKTKGPFGQATGSTSAWNVPPGAGFSGMIRKVAATRSTKVNSALPIFGLPTHFIVTVYVPGSPTDQASDPLVLMDP